MALPELLSQEHSLLFLILIALFSCAAGYRLWYAFAGPLSHFPGPTIASITSGWDIYQDIIAQRNARHLMCRLHEKYSSPIIRIRPNFLHINDPELFHEVFHSQIAYRKDPGFYAQFGVPGALGAETNPLIHQRQRKQLDPFFGSKGSEACYPNIRAKVDVMCQGLQQRQSAGEAVELVDLFKRLTCDVIYLLAFGMDLHYTDNFSTEASILTDMEATLGSVIFFKWVPGLNRLIFSLPLSVIGTFFGGYVKMRRRSDQLVQKNYSRILHENDKDRSLDSTIFDRFLRSFAGIQEGLNLTKVQIERLVDEAFFLIFAGSDTTAHALTTTLVCLCKYPEKMIKLRQEVECLGKAKVQDIQLATISQMPYLDAVIREATRLSSPISTVLPREITTTECVIGGYSLPKGTVVGFHLDDINRNPKFFPEPNEFIPERWSGEEGKKLQRWFVPFSKGARRCIGMDLAIIEMKLVVASIMTRFEIWLDNPNATLDNQEVILKTFKDDLRIRLRETAV